MVCIPCFAVPVLLFVWYKFFYPVLQPILQRYFGDRWFALPQDPNNCPVCPRKGPCDLRDKNTADPNAPATTATSATTSQDTSKKDE